MRSAKDLKDIVSSVRDKSNRNGIAGSRTHMLDETGDTDLGGEYGPDVGESS